MLSKIKRLALASVLAVSLAGTAQAAQTPQQIDVYYVPLQFVFDGEQYAPPEDQKSFIYEGSTYVPLRFLSYSLNKAVKWDGDSYTVSVEEPKDTAKIEIQEHNLNTKVRGGKLREQFDASQLAPTQVTVYQEKVQYVFDGKQKEIGEDLPGLFVDNRLYVPLRFFSESVGRKIVWDPKSYSIAADTPPAEKPPVKKEEPKKEEPKPAPAAPGPVGGGGGGGGFGGGAPTITKSVEAILADFQSSYDSVKLQAMIGMLEISNLHTEYLAITDPVVQEEKKDYYKDEALKIVKKYDDMVDAALNELGSKLQQHGHDAATVTSVKAEKKAEYLNQKKSLLSQYGVDTKYWYMFGVTP
ncbi:copper amine oxidase N-terminal domain-containing protein [Paenibacillus sp. YYML68]|uniref:copper amine oxidase N-terminal domain-containing protein n=1 Tax=Paenibacillus sp. YYML68 TaxID=2909250 RepID=UPI002491BB01|nr:copper amine oxidase N-terminal domain-containing protein [Paenibacillus sp. YYML68]